MAASANSCECDASFARPVESGSENRIDDEVRARQAARILAAPLPPWCMPRLDAEAAAPTCWLRSLSIPSAEPSNRTSTTLPAACKTAGGNQAVAAVVASATDHGDSVGSRPVRARKFSHRAAGVLHQRQGMQRHGARVVARSIADISAAVVIFNFFAPASDSNSRNCEGSPITIR